VILPSPRWLPLLRELGDLKRVRSAGQKGSLAERLFEQSWRRLVAGEEIGSLARDITARALVATRLGDLDGATLLSAGLKEAAVAQILDRAFEAAAAPCETGTLTWLRGAALGLRLDDEADPGVAVPAPGFVSRLANQPRAGATAPGQARVMFDPTESHAEHCLCVAVAAVLLAQEGGAEPGQVFLASLSHHLHNALLADSGFAGEMMLGEWLGTAMEGATKLALGELRPELSQRVANACRILPDAETPGGRVFHAADTLDRVLQMEHHLRAADTSMAFLQHDMGLMHEGPVKPFQDALLREMGLAA